jgi:hypothetical protein
MNPEIVSQLAHVGWGGFLTLIAALFLEPWQAAAVAALIAAGKESIESLWGAWEARQPWKDGLIDFAYFVVGIAAAFVLRAIAH